MNRREPAFEEFIDICMEADRILTELRKFPKLQGRRPSNLKVALIHYLARKKGVHITLHQLLLIYGKGQYTLMSNEKAIKGILEAEPIYTTIP